MLDGVLWASVSDTDNLFRFSNDETESNLLFLSRTNI